MKGRFIFAALCLAAASAALGQNIKSASAETPGPHPIARTDGRKILATIPTVDVESESETDCSHLVHEVYEQAGFSYEYVTSRELYIGRSTSFTRVREPQAGDLVVWRGHVGIVIDPEQHSFFSFVRFGPDTQFYDSLYWRSRGTARFFRYVSEKPLEAAGPADHKQVDSSSSEKHPPVKLAKPAPAPPSRPAPTVATSSPSTVETRREIVLQAAGKNPSPEEILSAFVEMNQDSGESLRTHSLNGSGKSIIVYRQLRVSAVQTKGKRGTALLRIESLGAPAEPQSGSPPRWREQFLEFEKTKRGWVMSPVKDTTYVKREVALQVLSARLADLAKNTDAAPEEEREQRAIIRLLNLLVAGNTRTASAQSN